MSTHWNWHMKQKGSVHFNKNSLQIKLDTLHVKNIQLISLICLHPCYHLFAKIYLLNRPFATVGHVTDNF